MKESRVQNQSKGSSVQQRRAREASGAEESKRRERRSADASNREVSFSSQQQFQQRAHDKRSRLRLPCKSLTRVGWPDRASSKLGVRCPRLLTPEKRQEAHQHTCMFMHPRLLDLDGLPHRPEPFISRLGRILMLDLLPTPFSRLFLFLLLYPSRCLTQSIQARDPAHLRTAEGSRRG